MRLFLSTLCLVALGSSSACLTTLCLSGVCGEQAAAPAERSAVPAVGAALVAPASSTTDGAVAQSPAERSGHARDLMRC